MTTLVGVILPRVENLEEYSYEPLPLHPPPKRRRDWIPGVITGNDAIRLLNKAIQEAEESSGSSRRSPIAESSEDFDQEAAEWRSSFAQTIESYGTWAKITNPVGFAHRRAISAVRKERTRSSKILNHGLSLLLMGATYSVENLYHVSPRARDAAEFVGSVQNQ